MLQGGKITPKAGDGGAPREHCIATGADSSCFTSSQSRSSPDKHLLKRDEKHRKEKGNVTTFGKLQCGEQKDTYYTVSGADWPGEIKNVPTGTVQQYGGRD